MEFSLSYSISILCLGIHEAAASAQAEGVTEQRGRWSHSLLGAGGCRRMEREMGKEEWGEHTNLAVQLQACLGKYTLVEENLTRKNEYLFNYSIITIVFVLVLHKAH